MPRRYELSAKCLGDERPIFATKTGGVRVQKQAIDPVRSGQPAGVATIVHDAPSDMSAAACVFSAPA